MADANGSHTKIMVNCCRACLDDTFIYLYKYTHDGKTHPGIKTHLCQVPEAGICIEVFTKEKDVVITYYFTPVN